MKKSCWIDYFQTYKYHRYSLFLAIVLSVAQSLVMVLLALLVAYLFNHVIKRPDFHLLVWIGPGIVMLYLLGNVLALMGRNQSLNVTKSVIKSIRVEIVQRLYSYPQKYYDIADRSKLHTIVVQDTERLDVMTNALISIILPAMVMSFGLLPILFYLNWELTLFLILIITPIYLVSGILKKRVQRFVYDFQRTFEDFSEGISSILQKMELTRTVGAESYEIQKQSQRIERLQHVSKRVAFFQALYTITQNSIVSISGILVLIIGGWATGLGKMTMGDLISYYFVVGLIRTQLRTLIGAFPQFIEGNESLASLCDLLRMFSDPQDEGEIKIRAESIYFKNVSFQYGNTFALKNINMKIPHRGIVVVTGSNGAGKSSLINLILGFYVPYQGELYVNDYPYSQVDLVFLRKSLGIVPQNPVLFQGTVWENITYGIPDVQEKDVINASKMALADQFIKNLSAGYDTVIGERGIRLSGGERQRIAISRAFLRNTPMLLMDEPMTYLDKEIVSQLIKVLKELSNNKSILIITHNMDVISQADFVYHLDRGKIDFVGTPEDYFSVFRRFKGE